MDEIYFNGTPEDKYNVTNKMIVLWIIKVKSRNLYYCYSENNPAHL
ncbi:hypothetical protein F990_01183 [Acinetobacter tjernbergiae DSM 14971 = CIP 107465]|uniref:Uncharacterized protein n=1 Tax=Acinetobacter tjernbergiae DSM 14971 = CIP 107465 TaxID=1120928 RepID=V2V5J0_9GAMM|nr:hypothetical protein F990_01183 [Acinetobacter tjernbergiae DSM 14971 = CIP 107465]